MIHRFALVLCLFTAPLVFATGCGSTPSTASTAVDDAQRTAKLESVLADYEAVRAALAADKLGDVPALATTLENSAKAAQPHASGSAAEPIAAILRDIQPLKRPGEPDEVRRHFGDLSHSIVSILAADESLRATRFVFECPMAQGYQKWVQLSERVENPYMGSSMLRCGGPSDWKP